jgi:hypothetical protein
LARVLAIIYGGLFGVTAIISVPILLFSPFPAYNAAPVPRSVFVTMLILYPLMGVFVGWIGGHIVARLYNFVARRFGGIQYEAEIV